MSGRGKEERGRHKGLERIKTGKNKEKIRQLAEGGLSEAGVLDEDVGAGCELCIPVRRNETTGRRRRRFIHPHESLVINAARCDL